MHNAHNWPCQKHWDFQSWISDGFSYFFNRIGLFELETVITCVIMAGILGYMRVRSQQVMERSWNSSSAGLNGIGDIPLNAVITCYLWVKVGMQLWQIRIRLLPQN